MSYVFIADDFTGASDTLATLAKAGLRVRLFRDLPGVEDLKGLDVWGIATDARSLGQADMVALSARIGRGLRAFHPDFLHVKICSTFDSSATTGNVAMLAQGLAAELDIDAIAVLAGQPSLGRYCVFGTLFARGPDGLVHRIDRHPVMSAHPVTPMQEADLSRHLDALGLHGLHLVPRGGAGAAFPRLYDLLDQGDVVQAGHDLAVAKRPLLVMGASSVAEAWLSAQPARPLSQVPPCAVTGPIFAFAGSRSSLTSAQVDATTALSCLPVSATEMVEDGESLLALRRHVLERLEQGHDCLVHLVPDAAGRHIQPAVLAKRAGDFVHAICASRGVGGLIVAGGDTSSAILNRLAPEWLDYAGGLCPGVPILRTCLQGRDLCLALKGGQMGGLDFFDRAAAALRGAADAT
ncbi:four-carbon acid sugar kinase family protein [Pseudotabrizicola formosa]|uniref:four-carbon acid sugar kinase family protein n=1 Tax=Pseudotabrizicola formosa TaxID=2030009 RepID=UPI000CD2F658|nr:four-carbon acid sugar kinase family protein [Pseudotabrizicola formosa]